MTPNWLGEVESASALEAALAGCTEVSDDAKARLRDSSEAELVRHVEDVDRMLRRFAAAVAAAMDDGDAAEEFVRNLDLRVVSRDHDWRAVFGALRDAGKDAGEQHVVALRRYLQYLRSRRELIERVRAQHTSLHETSECSIPPMPQEEREDPTDRSRSALARLSPLPSGEPVRVRLPTSGAVMLRLGRHVFRLTGDSPPRLIDPLGNSHELEEGRRHIGRHPESDLRIDSRLRDISRLHLVAEWLGRDVVCLTDLSSLGTSVDAAALEEV